jgi:hypothetical protein
MNRVWLRSFFMSKYRAQMRLTSLLMLSTFAMTSCADVRVPGNRDVNIPTPRSAEERKAGINERPDAVTYLPLGEDVLLPEADSGAPLPSTIVGPFELRSETLAGALQLVLDGFDIPIAFETSEGLNRTITITNLKGPLDSVVSQICGLSDLYCSYQNGILVVKDTQIFTVTIPPIVASDQIGNLLTNISAAVGNIVGLAPITDASTRTIVYKASQRTAEMAERYFQRLRMNTALVVFETYVWEVSLDAGNTTGIRWQNFDHFGKFNVGINLPGAANPALGTPISIGLPTTGTVNFTTNDVVQFISDYGAVKTVSQPQLTVLSGSSARLRVADTQNYVASISRTTTDGGNTTVSTSTDSVDSGFTLEISSNWDNASVYTNLNILLQEVRGIDTFDENPDAVVQLPQTTERELQTQVRIRPGDSLLIAGLVRENDAFDKAGLGISRPILPISRSATTTNSELVFLIRPRVIVFTTDKTGAVPPEPMKAPVPAPAPEPGPEAGKSVPESSKKDDAGKTAPVQYGPPVGQPVAKAEPVEELAPVTPVQKEAIMEKPAVASKQDVAPPISKKPASATSDPSVIIDYNMLQGD